MIELIQFPWSPFCIVQRRILEYSGVPFRIRNIPPSDRSLVWRLTRQRYHGVPIIRHNREVIFEVSDESQVIAKYLDTQFQLNLFPHDKEGLQTIVYTAIESQIEDVTFRLNDIYYKEFVSPREQLHLLRYKERKFGRGCIEQWTHNQQGLLDLLRQRLAPYEQMLAAHDFLLGPAPVFVDFDLAGMLENFLYSGHYELPSDLTCLRAWYTRVSKPKKLKRLTSKALEP